MYKFKFQLSISNLVIALIFIYVGAWFLLDNLGILNESLKNALIVFIPYLLAVMGLCLLIRPFIRNYGLSGDWLFGLFFFPYGLLLIAGYYNYIPFTWSDGWKLWPIAIIYVGSVMLFHKKS
ncbi:MAG: LiaF transmembrane domain-containing protein [Tuberibacillus sp.]